MNSELLKSQGYFLVTAMNGDKSKIFVQELKLRNNILKLHSDRNIIQNNFCVYFG